MTDKIMEARREKFERWQWPHLNNAEHLRGTSMYEDAWEVWNAALDSLCVELPATRSAQFPDFEGGFESGVDAAREAIHAAGVKTK